MRWIAIWTACLFAAVGVAVGASPVLNFGFDSGTEALWTVESGSWCVEDGVLTGQSGFLLFDMDFPTDRRVQVDLVALDGESATVVGKYADDTRWVEACFTMDGVALRLNSVGREASWSGTAALAPQTTVVLAFVEDQARVIVNGEVVIQAQDPAFAEFGGRVGLAVQGTARFDNLSVTAFTGPVVITSLGQSPGALMIQILADRVGLENIYEPVASSELLDGSGALILIVGASSKGLGAAGISIDSELARGWALVHRARELGLPVLVMHIEGAARRGDLSDQIIAEFVPVADYVVVKADGNADGLFTTLTHAHSIPLATVAATAQTADVLVDLFGLWH
ncbi:MAG: DUF6305 family protein [Candidatus Bipolaricaulis sp.]|nr:DUF6305 family protein [Candidatus Bipolaricaulis sp.]